MDIEVTESLTEFLLSEGEPEDFNNSGFVITTEDQAIWAMRKLADAQRKIDAITLRAETERRRINAWEDQSTKPFSSTVEYFAGLLGSYATCQRDEGVKHLSYPDGYVQTRATQDKVVVADNEKFVDWAISTGHQSWIRTHSEADLGFIKSIAQFSDENVISDTGEVVEGLRHIPAGVSVSIKVSE